MANKEVLLTKEGLQKLVDELEYAKTIERKEVVEALALARSFGDLSENAEYDAAKNAQSELEGRIRDLEYRIKNAKVIDQVDNGEVNLGSTVVLEDMETGEKETYTLVGTTEADPFENRISNESPVGQAIIGKSVDTVVVAHTPAGDLSYRILEVK